MSDGLTGKCLRLFTLVLLAVIVVGGAALAYPSWRRGQALKRQEADLHRQIEGKKREIAKLIENQKRFKTDPDFVEAIARRYNCVYPGEYVFIFED